MKNLRKPIIVEMYDVAIVLMAIKVMLDRIIYINVPDVLDSFLIAFSLCLFMISIIFESQHYLGEWIIIVVIGIASLYASIRAGEYFLLMTIVLILSMVNKDLNRVIRLSRNVKIIGVTISVLWYIYAYWIKHDTKYIIMKEGRISHHFGFTHPNSFAIMLCWILMETLFLTDVPERKKWCIPFPIIGIITYWLTSCDTILIVLAGTSMLVFLDEYKFWNQLLWNISKIIFPVLSVLNALCIYIYSLKGGILFDLVYWLDEKLTARIRQAAWIYEKYGVSIIGRSLPIGKEIMYDNYYRLSRLMLDGLYSNLLLSIGLFFTVLFSIMIWHGVKRNKSWTIFAIIYSVYGIIETHGLNAYVVFSMAIFGYSFMNDIHLFLKKKNEEGNT